MLKQDHCTATRYRATSYFFPSIYLGFIARSHEIHDCSSHTSTVPLSKEHIAALLDALVTHRARHDERDPGGILLVRAFAARRDVPTWHEEHILQVGEAHDAGQVIPADKVTNDERRRQQLFQN